ncbi:MAG: twin-arginine translocase subunit TatC [Actinomycetota bacterium]|nr:twin-arginine translocase subunit TatC [Actinomycetota bacterium]
MTLVEHLEELRRRIIISLAAVALTSVVGFVFNRQILAFLVRPYRRALDALPAQARPAGAFGEGLVFSSPVDAFLTVLKVAFFTGFMLALPVLLWQVWRFVTPGLTRRERRLAIPFVVSSVALFAGGTAFAFAVLPRGLGFLLGFGGANLVPLLHADRYISFLIFLILAFGLSFEFPLLMIFLAGARVVTTRQLRSWRRYAYFGIAVFAAVATPTQDPYTMLLMCVPLVLFYEGAILVARLFKR